MNSLVSIITPSYNSEKFIASCIQSVVNQTYENWELLIVDDCSKDNSVALIKELVSNDDRIKPIFLTNNVGPATARNLAIKSAKGRFIAFLDSDDMWVSNKLEEQLKFMEEGSIAFSYTAYIRISEDDTKEYNVIRAPKSMGYQSYLKNTAIGCLTVILDRNKISDVEMPNVRSSQDMALWLKIMRTGVKAYGLNKVLAKYRLVSTSNTSNKIKATLGVWKVYREIEQLSLFYSLYCFVSYAFNAIKRRL